MQHAVIKVRGMSCQGCVASVTRVLEAIDGVAKVNVSLEQEEAAVDFDAGKTELQALRQAVDEAGYESG